jgi:hypothetical protein
MLERKADSPSYCFFEKSSEKEERLERAFVRPRQVRYQAALRPDMIGQVNSKALSNFVTTPTLGSRPRPCLGVR